MENENEEKQDKKDILAYIDTPRGLFMRSDSIIQLIDDAIEAGKSASIEEESIIGMEAIKERFLRDFDRINIKKLVG